MRTTVTLDPDVAAKLKEAAREQGVSFKEALNSNVRRGLEAQTRRPATRAYRVQTRSMGTRPGIDLVKALRLAGELEDAETVEKLRRRK